MRVFLPKCPFSVKEYESLKKYSREVDYDEYKMDVTPSEKSKIFLVLKNSKCGITVFYETQISGMTYRFAVNDFGIAKTYEKSPLQPGDYNMFSEIWETHVIPELSSRLYDIIGLKLKEYSLSEISKSQISGFIEVKNENSYLCRQSFC